MNLLHKAFFLGGTTAEDLQLTARPIGPDGLEMGQKEPPGSFYSHGGRLGKLLFDDTVTDSNLNTWPVGVVGVKQCGANTLDEFETMLRHRIKVLESQQPSDAPIIKCSLDRGSWEDANGFQWDRAGRSDCTSWAFQHNEPFTSVSLLKYHGGKVGPWSPKFTPERLPSHNQWNLYFESDDGASHYFLYSALIHDATQKLRRYVLRELLLMMNWRIVVQPEQGSFTTTAVMAKAMSVRRLAPLTLLAIGLTIAVLVRCACVKAGMARRRRQKIRWGD